MIRRIKQAFEILRAPYFRTSVLNLRGCKHGPTLWQEHHHKAKDALHGCSKKKRSYTSVWDRWQNDQTCRESQVAIGLSDAWVRYLDHIAHQTACTDAHSVSQHILNRMITFHHANTRGSRAARLKIAHLCVPKQLSSMCHVSFLAAPDTDHKHKFSLNYFFYLSDNLTNIHNTFGARSIFTLRSSTAEWRINTKPISHRLQAQND